MQNILITGSSGFIGSHLVEELSKKDKIFCILRNKNKIHLFKLKNIKPIFCDLANKILLKKELDHYSFDIVIHLAYEGLGKDSKKIYIKNLTLTKNLLDCITEKKIKHFIFMSSCAVYDKIPMDKKANEDYPLNPKSYYGKSKIKSEILVEEYATRFNFPYTIFRAHMVYGYRDKNIFPLISLMKKCSVIPLINNGNYYVQPIFIGDVTKAIIYSIHNKNVFNKIYNLAGLNPILFKDLARLIAKELDFKKKFVNIPFVIALPGVYLIELFGKILNQNQLINRTIIKRAIQNSAYDISKIERDLKLKLIPIEEGIRKIVQNEHSIN